MPELEQISQFYVEHYEQPLFELNPCPGGHTHSPWEFIINGDSQTHCIPSEVFLLEKFSLQSSHILFLGNEHCAQLGTLHKIQPPFSIDPYPVGHSHVCAD